MNVSDFEVSAVAFMKAVEADGVAGVSGDLPIAGEGAVAALTLLGLSDVDGTASAVGGAGGSGVLGDDADGAAGGSAAAVATSEGLGSVVQAESDATGGQGGNGGIILSPQNVPAADGKGGSGGQAIGSDATATDLSADGFASSTARQTGGAGGSGGVFATSAMGGVASGTEASAYGHSAAATVVQTGGAGGSDVVSGGSGADSTLINAVTGATTGGTLVLSQTAVGGAGGGSSIGPGAGGAASSTLSFDDTTNAIAAQSVNATSDAVGGAAGGGAEHATTFGGDATASLALTADGPVTALSTATGGIGSPTNVYGIEGSGGTATATVSAASLTGPADATAVAQGGVGIEASPYENIRASSASAAATATAQSGQEATANATATGYIGTVTTAATTSGSGLVSAVSASTDTTISARSASASEVVYGGDGFGFDTTSNNYAYASAVPVSVGAPFATLLGSGTQGSKLTQQGAAYTENPFGVPQAETFTSVDSFTVDGSGLGGELEAALTGAVVSGGGFSSLDFVVDVGGATVVDDAFTSAAAAAAFFNGTTLDLGPVGSGPVAVSFELDLTTSTVGDGFGETFVLGTAGAPPCFAAGTRVLTEAGEVAVEDLVVGQKVVTEDGVLPVVWIGRRRVECRASERPVRVLAGAFGDGLPRRDLVLSPDHAVFASGVLIPVQALVDGAAVVRDGRERITYYHVELERHAILRAEGLPVESYLDTGNRGRFSNAPIVALRSEAATVEPCAPMAFAGPVVDAVRAALRAPDWALAG